MPYQKTTYEGDYVIRNVLIEDIEEFLHPLGFHTRAKYLYKIRTKAGKTVFYKPWDPQIIVDRIIREEYNRSLDVLGTIKVLIMYLKARQEGLSTDTSLRMIDRMLFNESFFAQVLAHDYEGTSLLYNQYKRAFYNLPDFVQVVDVDGSPITNGGQLWRFPIKPGGQPIKGGIKFKLRLFPDHDIRYDIESELITQTAGKGDNAGKAGSINGVHFSENANYEKHDDVVSSVNQMLGGDEIFGVKESTANGTSGIGEAFYRDWTSEENAWLRFKSGENTTFEGWRPVFLPWYWMPTYRKPLYQGKKVSLDGIEWESEKEKREYLEWEEQVEGDIIPNDPEVDHNSFDVREATNFYRDVIKTKCQRKLANARRYYPTTPEEAFITSDKCFFSTNKIITVESNLKSNPTKDYVTGELNTKGEFVERHGGPLKIKRFPEKDWLYRYVISCDQSKGYEEADYSHMSVFDRVDRDFIAYWNGIIPETQLAIELNKICYFYNNGLSVPEENRMTVINLIKPDGHERYKGPLYFVKDNTSAANRREPKWGYQMNVASRKYAIDKLFSFMEADENSNEVPEHEILRNYPKLFTEEHVGQYKNFIRHVKGGRSKFEAAPGKKDDIVIGDALTLVGDEWWEKAPQKQVNKRRGERSAVVNINTNKPVLRNGNNGVRQSSLGKGRKKKYTMHVGGGLRQSKLGR